MSNQDVRRETTESIVVEWLTERLANCERIAKTKAGSDREGWLDDAAGFAAALKIVADYDTMKTRLEETIESLTMAVNAGAVKVTQQAAEIARLRELLDAAAEVMRNGGRGDGEWKARYDAEKAQP